MTDLTKNSSAYDTLIRIHDKITHINGNIMLESVNKLKDELGGICMLIKTHHYRQGQKYSHLASVIPKLKYRIIIGENTWTHTAPVDPGTYLPAAVIAEVAAALRDQIVAKHKVLQSNYANYLSVEEAGKDLILYAVGADPLAPLKKLYIGFGDTMILTMLDHLRQKTAIKMTTSQKYKYKNTSYNTPWDSTTSITTYFTSLDHFQTSLGESNIATSDAKKTMAAGAQMWQSKMFTEDQIVAWESKPTADQTWINPQVYFTKKWLKQKQYLATTAKQSRFKEVALLAQETEAAQEEGETQAMLFAMLQEQHNKQMAMMVASNKANMDTMMECMNVLVAAGGGRRMTNKENVPPFPATTPINGSTVADYK
jgi:hypothetical protein